MHVHFKNTYFRIPLASVSSWKMPFYSLGVISYDTFSLEITPTPSGKIRLFLSCVGIICASSFLKSIMEREEALESQI
jgi:hypothetical protein